MPDDEPDIRTILASERERGELTQEQGNEVSRELLAVLQRELESIEATGAPTASSMRFAVELWDGFLAQKLKRMNMVSEHLAHSVGFIERAPSATETAMVAHDQVGSLESMTLELRVLETGARLFAAVRSAADQQNGA